MEPASKILNQENRKSAKFSLAVYILHILAFFQRVRSSRQGKILKISSSQNCVSY